MPVKRTLIPIYDGAIRANYIGSFTKNNLVFDIVRPGYDSQGRRRISWTQFIYQGIPVFEVKSDTELSRAIKIFDEKWKIHVDPEPALVEKALQNCIKERRRKFKDGQTGIEPAPALTVDGRNQENHRVR